MAAIDAPQTAARAPATATGRPSGPAQVRADRRFRVALIGFCAGLAFTAALAFIVPWLTALDGVRAGFVRIFAVIVGVVLAIAVAALGPSGEPPGARLAARLGVIITLVGAGTVGLGVLAGVFVSPSAGLPFDRSSAVALCAGGLGSAIVVATLAAIAASTAGRTSSPSSGVRLPVLIGSATAALTIATWSLASAHVVGHLQASSRQSAVEEARDLAQLLATVGPSETERLMVELAPPGGFAARIDEAGRVIPGAMVGIGRDSILRLNDGPPSLCRVLGQLERPRPLPCGIRSLEDGTRIVVGVTELQLSLGVLTLFMIVGMFATIGAFGIGARFGQGPAEELERVAAVLDELAHASGIGGLDRPIPAVSLDEVGDLAVALAKLRVRLRPGLVEHDEALSRANAADRERDQFLALVSDELRAPLDHILGSARALLEDEGAPLTASQREDIRLIVSSSTHLTELIEEVLDLSAIATGQVTLRKGEVDLASLVMDVARTQRPLIGARPVELRVESKEQLPRLVADERRLRQVITNLVSNAVKFTAKGTVTISTVEQQGSLVLAITDTGPGIDAAHLPRLFTEFVQLGTLRQRARGTGLGLAICKRLIDAHGGTIEASSELGVGTTFSVRLPLRSEAA